MMKASESGDVKWSHQKHQSPSPYHSGHLSSPCAANTPLSVQKIVQLFRDPSFIGVHLLHGHPLLTPPISLGATMPMEANGDPIQVLG